MRPSASVSRTIANRSGIANMTLLAVVQYCATVGCGCLAAGVVLGLDGSLAQAQRKAKEKELDTFLQKQESRASNARTNLLKSIDKCMAVVKQLPLDDDTKELRIRPLRDDRAEFINSDRLPKSPELSDGVYRFVADDSKILEGVSKRRAAIEKDNAAAGPGKAVSITGIKNLESRLTRMVGGGDKFTQGSAWGGKRQFPDAMGDITLVVKQRAGTSFTGELFEFMGGGHSGMNIQGKIYGNQVALETTSTIVGKNHYLYLEGVIVQDRFIGGVAQSAGGKPGSWFMLHAKQK